MNKKRVELYLPYAVKAINDCGIAQNNKVIKTYRSNISGFGAAVAAGSFKAAVAFYSSDAKEEGERANTVQRSKLIQAMDYIVKAAAEKKQEIVKMNAAEENRDIVKMNVDGAIEKRSITKIICEIINSDNDSLLKEQYLDASIALKLAMNAYVLIDPDAMANYGKQANREG